MPPARPAPADAPDDASAISALDLDADRFAGAVLRALSTQSVSQRELARRLGIRQQSVSGWLTGRARPSTDHLRAVLGALAIDWADVRRPTPPATSSAETVVSVYTDIRASGGPGFSVDLLDGDEARRLSAAKELLTALLGFRPPDALGALYVEGESMVNPRARSGGLPDGQFVLFEPLSGIADFVSGARYVLVADDHAWGRRVHVKRLHLGLDGVLTVASDNPRAPAPEERLVPDPDGEPGQLVHATSGRPVSVAVVGRVVWPRESDDERTVRAVTETIERLVASGFFPG